MPGETQLNIPLLYHIQGVTAGTLGGVKYIWVVGQKTGSSSYWLWRFLASDLGASVADYEIEDDFTHADYSGTSIGHLSAPGFYDDGGDGQIFIVAKDSTGPKDHRYNRYNATTGAYIDHTKIGTAGNSYNEWKISGADVQQSGESNVYTINAGATDDKIHYFTIAEILSGTDQNTPTTVNLSVASSGAQGVAKGHGRFYVPVTSNWVNEYLLDGTFVRVFYRSTRINSQGCYWDGDTFMLATYTTGTGDYIHQFTAKEGSVIYLDGLNGSDSNDGFTLDKAFLTLDQAGGQMHPGTEMRISNFGATNPMRGATIINGNSVGTADYSCTHVGETHCLAGTDISEGATYTWTESPATAGEYYMTLVGGGSPSFTAAQCCATCSAAVWTASGTEGLIERLFATVGSLTAGTFGDGDNDTLGVETIYYKPAAGEDITTLHIEGVTGNVDALGLSRAYSHFHDWKIFMAGNRHIDIPAQGVKLFNVETRLSGKSGTQFWSVTVSGADVELYNAIIPTSNRSLQFNAGANNFKLYGGVIKDVYVNKDLTGIIIRNPILTSNIREQDGTGPLVIDSDFILTQGATHATWTAHVGSNDIEATDPLLVDPANFDFTLQASSPAINAGEAWWAGTDPAPQDFNGVLYPQRKDENAIVDSVNMGVYSTNA